MSRKNVVLGCLLLLMLGGGYAVVATIAARFERQTALQAELTGAIQPYHFDLLTYEWQALAGKLRDAVAQTGQRLTSEEQNRLVWQYRQRALAIAQLEDGITSMYADPAVIDADAASAELRGQLAQLRSAQKEIRALVEAVLEQQVTATLADLNLTTAGQVWPPLRFTFSALPNYLILSPRDRIELEASVYLAAELDLAEITQIEQQAAQQFDRSALVEELGGIGVWPTIVYDQAGLSWTLSTIAHEWVHNYMAFHPLGWHMFDHPQMNTINETVASIVGDEVGQLLAFQRYGIAPPSPAPSAPNPTPDPNRFDFGAEMRRTRLHVDELLAAGQVDEAERYMEERRRLFVAKGYPLRKLNQAYFAFHGSYATGAAATDPIGPKLRTLRTQMPSLAAFVEAVRTIRAPADLDALLAESGGMRARPANLLDTSSKLCHNPLQFPNAVFLAAPYFFRHPNRQEVMSMDLGSCSSAVASPRNNE